MRSNRFIVSILLCLCAATGFAQAEKWGMNRPYIDDKLFHMGFQIGLNYAGFGVSTVSSENDVRVSGSIPGFHVAFVGDLRLHKNVNLRFCPGLQFISDRMLSFDTIDISNTKHTVHVMSIPINIPLYLKISANREANYRPYVIAGGGASFNVNQYGEKDIVGLKIYDAFCEIGFGVDIYLPWFKLCPEITYRIGFLNQYASIKDGERKLYPATPVPDPDRISRLTNQCICLTFNFE